MFTVMDSTERTTERCLDSQLWHACAGPMVQMPPLNSKVFYFPQGHAEHAHQNLDLSNLPPLIPSKVSSLKYMADPNTDEVYVKIKLTPFFEKGSSSFQEEEEEGDHDQDQKPASFAKTLTQSDANNGGGFSVPRYCAETIFPRLDYSAEPPVQTIIAKDMHGQCWKFRHIYRGTPRRHLLTTGWSNFVNHKKLVAGDSIVFLRAFNGDLCVGIRRAKKGIGFGADLFPFGSSCSGFLCGKCCSSSSGESVIEAVTCAVNGKPFEVVYYPRASTPEFCVKASVVKAAMQIQWCSGMRFKMPFETEDSSRISWFMGTISSIQVQDPIRWPHSPWRLLQVVWDEPDLLQNVKCVNPWLVELVSNMPAFNLSSFSPPRKKQRFIQDPYFNLINQLPMPPSLSSNLVSYTNSLCNIQDNNNNNSSSSSIQGARHGQFGSAPSDFPFNKLQQNMFLTKLQQPKSNVDISCLLSMGNSGQSYKESSSNEVKAPQILLFGKLIQTEQKSSNSGSIRDWDHFPSISTTENTTVSDGTTCLKTSKANSSSSDNEIGLHQSSPVENSSDDGGSPWYKDQHKSDLGTENVSSLCMAL